MDRTDINAICAEYPGAECSEPFGPGHDVWKVGGKIFAAIGADAGGVSVKTPDTETAAMLIEAGIGGKAPYFHRSWVLVPFERGEAEIRHRLDVAYATIRDKLPKKLRATLK
ncbi:MAG: MmcQ/YjbR family DNA-binding protein [Rhodobacteraceae bacterium]|nr:MmcQ/YjbR family DNA-binding protein [Paracoccaceae bacterium]